LEELYEGCSKKIKVSRRRLRENKTLQPEDAVISVDIKPGWKNGTRITFEGDGNEAIGQTAGDLVFILTEKPHPRFTRRSNNLHYTATISLAQALTGCTVEVLTLDRRTLPIAINQIVSPGYTQSVVGEGLPNPKDPKKSGDLILEFKIIFPTTLSDHQKATLAKVLPS